MFLEHCDITIASYTNKPHKNIKKYNLFSCCDKYCNLVHSVLSHVVYRNCHQVFCVQFLPPSRLCGLV